MFKFVAVLWGGLMGRFGRLLMALFGRTTPVPVPVADDKTKRHGRQGSNGSAVRAGRRKSALYNGPF